VFAVVVLGVALILIGVMEAYSEVGIWTYAKPEDQWIVLAMLAMEGVIIIGGLALVVLGLRAKAAPGAPLSAPAYLPPAVSAYTTPAATTAPSRFCMSCGTEVPAVAKFCTRCGARQS
jgi:hypothetical protein